MKTLYDLLGALPDDDAESLRIAFRQAVKATHPDVNTDDPDAPLRFRRIVRANAILSDPNQRATYDRLLALALRQSKSKPKRSFFSGTMRKVASDAIAVAVLSVVLMGGYAIFSHLSKASDIPAKMVTVAARVPAETAAGTSPLQLDMTGQVAPRDKPGMAAARSEAIVPSAGAPRANADSAAATAAAAPALGLTANNARSFHERGIVAYLDGDLYRALADFDVAIQIDPGFADAYLDRGIAFYGIHEFDRAIADIAEAKRIKNSNGARLPPQAPQKASPVSARN